MIDRDEYKTLRDEILHSYTIVDSSRNILYIAVAYILTFATNKENPLLYLLPFTVIIPIYLIAINYTFDIYRIATYIKVFAEADNSTFRWESRQFMLNTEIENRMPRQAKMFHVPYVSSGIMCTILFFASIDLFSQTKTEETFFSIVLCIIFFVILICIFIYFRDMISVQRKYIEAWEEVKAKECVLKDENIR